MANENSRYNVKILLDITDASTGSPTEFSQTIQKYFDLPYEYMQQIQSVGIPALVSALMELGNQTAAEIAERRAKGQNK